MCGLGVVCNEIRSANLDREKDFITIIPNDKFNDIPFIQKAIEENRKISIQTKRRNKKICFRPIFLEKYYQNQYLENIKNLL